MKSKYLIIIFLTFFSIHKTQANVIKEQLTEIKEELISINKQKEKTEKALNYVNNTLHKHCALYRSIESSNYSYLNNYLDYKNCCSFSCIRIGTSHILSEKTSCNKKRIHKLKKILTKRIKILKMSGKKLEEEYLAKQKLLKTNYHTKKLTKNKSFQTSVNIKKSNKNKKKTTTCTTSNNANNLPKIKNYSVPNSVPINNLSESDSLYINCYICKNGSEKIIPMKKLCNNKHKDEFICKTCYLQNKEKLANKCPLCRGLLK